MCLVVRIMYDIIIEMEAQPNIVREDIINGGKEIMDYACKGIRGSTYSFHE